MESYGQQSRKETRYITLARSYKKSSETFQFMIRIPYRMCSMLVGRGFILFYLLCVICNKTIHPERVSSVTNRMAENAIGTIHSRNGEVIVNLPFSPWNGAVVATLKIHGKSLMKSGM